MTSNKDGPIAQLMNWALRLANRPTGLFRKVPAFLPIQPHFIDLQSERHTFIFTRTSVRPRVSSLPIRPQILSLTESPFTHRVLSLREGSLFLTDIAFLFRPGAVDPQCGVLHPEHVFSPLPVLDLYQPRGVLRADHIP